jgi:hypothetical protein
MTQPRTTNLEEAIRHAGEGWLIDWFEPRDQAMSHLRQSLENVARRAGERLGGNAPNLSEAALVDLYNKYPHKVKGFFQVLGGTRTPDILLMAWRIIQGMEIKNIEMDYHRQDHFVIRVTLESPYGEGDELYESSAIQDFTVFRHIGTMEISGKPVFDGFYPLKVKA